MDATIRCGTSRVQKRSRSGRVDSAACPPCFPCCLGGAIDPVQNDDLAQLEMGDQRHGLSGQDDLVAIAAGDAGHLGEQADRCRVKSELRFVQNHGCRKIGSE